MARQGVRGYSDGVLSNRMRIPLNPEVPVPPAEQPGGSEFASRFQHWQEIAVNQMTIDHNLGARPAAITLLSEDGQTRYMSFGTDYVSQNRVVITTELPFRGWVLIS